MEEFKDVLKAAREASFYRTQTAFAKTSGIHIRDLEKYEDGEVFPKPETLEKIIRMTGIPESTAQHLRKALNDDRAKRLGLKLDTNVPDIDIPSLAEKIQREIEYELKRERIRVPLKTSRVCQRRVAIILKSALELK